MWQNILTGSECQTAALQWKSDINPYIHNYQNGNKGDVKNIIAHINSLKGGKVKKKKRKPKFKLEENCSSSYGFGKINDNGSCKPMVVEENTRLNNKNIFSASKKAKLALLHKNNRFNNNEIEFKHNCYNNKFSKHRQSLPIFEVKYNLINFVMQHETSVLVGETGCGKSTQVPQFLYECRLYKNGLICITQPRKIAATSLARRVAEEMSTNIGDTVGYAVRFDEKVSGKTKIKYVTDGMLLREALSDPLLLKYLWIILDEAHERTVNTDVLFGIVKKAQRIRKAYGKKELRVIIMSATMDVDHIVSYFRNADAKVIDGRQHDVKYTFVSKSQKDYYLMCLSLFLRLHETKPVTEGFLIFLTGQDEIEHFVKQINSIHEDKLFSHTPKVDALPLYAQLPDYEQIKVFKPPGCGKRKVIVSTNIAETSLTIPGISLVIDSGHVKTRSQNPNTGFEELTVEKISKAQAFQRAGRAGREGLGYYFSALTKEEFGYLKENPTPEIVKSELSSTYLTLLGAGIKNVIKFDYVDRPPMKHLQLAETDLRDLKVISGIGDTLVLTELGKRLKYLPLKPHFGKVILMSAELGCSDEMLTIISILSCESIYVNPTEKQDIASMKRKRFRAVEGDHIAFLNVFNAFKATKNSKEWCRKHYLNFRNLEYASNIRSQLVELCEKRGIPIISCQISQDPYKVEREPVLKSLISGLFKNVARRQPRGKYKCLKTEQEISIHPSSLLFGVGAEFILFTTVIATGKSYMNINSIIDPQWLKEVCPEYYHSMDLPVLQNIFSVVG